MEKKTHDKDSTRFTFKGDDAEPGAFSVVFSTTGVVDKDHDIVLDSAIEDGLNLPLIQSHEWESRAVGGGVTRTNGAQKILDGRFYLDTFGGADAYRTTKNLIADGVNQEFSWGFIVDERRDPDKVERAQGAENVIVRTTAKEVSLVLSGAGLDTAVASLKAGEDAAYMERELDARMNGAAKTTFDEQITATLAAIDDVIQRAGIRAANRQANDRPIGKADVARLDSLQAKLRELLALATKTTEAVETSSEETAALNAIRLRNELGLFQ